MRGAAYGEPDQAPYPCGASVWQARDNRQVKNTYSMPRSVSKKKNKTGCEVVGRFQNDLRSFQNGLSEGPVMKTAWDADGEQAGQQEQ